MLVLNHTQFKQEASAPWPGAAAIEILPFAPSCDYREGWGGSGVCCSLSSQAVPRCRKSPRFLQTQGWCCRGAPCCRNVPPAQRAGLGLSPAAGSPLHPKTGDVTTAAAGDRRDGVPTACPQRAHVPAPRLESSAAPDTTCNLRRLISSSSRLESLNQENNILFPRPCASCTSDHTAALAKDFDACRHRERSRGFLPSQRAHCGSKEHH